MLLRPWNESDISSDEDEDNSEVNWSTDDSSLSSHFESSDDDNNEQYQEFEERSPLNFATGLLRHRRHNSVSAGDAISPKGSPTAASENKWRPMPRNTRRRKRLVGWCLSRQATPCLFVCLMIWACVYITCSDGPWFGDWWHFSPEQRRYAQDVQQRLGPPLARHVAGSSIGSILGGAPRRTRRRNNNGTSIEAIPQGCSLQKWHEQSYPTCNALHEIDLSLELDLPGSNHLSVRARKHPMGSYISSGMWRDVWSIPDSILPDHHDPPPLSVLKLMRPEWDVTERNLERHRRDALTMERLSSSPNIVDLFAYCANTVLTERAPRDLSTAMQQHGHDALSPQTRLQRLRYARQASMGIAAIHAQDVVHADLQSKQFLVDDDGTVKLNDFNRCRFLPRGDRPEQNLRHSPNQSNQTREDLSAEPVCPIRIPSAPGNTRSPEEYTGDFLTEALDVYSLGNVLYEILVGHIPYKGVGSSRIKTLIRQGQKPEIPNEYREHPLDADFAVLIHMCYERDASRRIRASELVQEFDNLITKATREYDIV